MYDYYTRTVQYKRLRFQYLAFAILDIKSGILLFKIQQFEYLFCLRGFIISIHTFHHDKDDYHTSTFWTSFHKRSRFQ